MILASFHDQAPYLSLEMVPNEFLWGPVGRRKAEPRDRIEEVLVAMIRFSGFSWRADRETKIWRLTCPRFRSPTR